MGRMEETYSAHDSGRFDVLDFIMRYEAGEASYDETVEGFQQMIDDGTVWQLQGSYGRTAERLIERGACRRACQSGNGYPSPVPQNL